MAVILLRAREPAADAGTEENDAASVPASRPPLVAFSSRATRHSPCLPRNLNAIPYRPAFLSFLTLEREAHLANDRGDGRRGPKNY